ncbi:MAG: pyrroline-5-carboxylate reductase [Anaerolineae bacterium]
MAPSDTRHRIALVGGGTMAEAIIARLVAEGYSPAKYIRVGEPIAERRKALEETYGILAFAGNGEAVSGADLVILAIKPQALAAALGGLRGTLDSDTLVLSIVAGATIAQIHSLLDVETIVRAMPNTPCQIGEGATVWVATEATSQAQRDLAGDILQLLGLTIEVHEERYLNMATALSGSGPAYVFLFIEAMVEAGVRLGFARSTAERLALQTVRGAAIYAQETGLSPAELRARVTSPGGTTAEGLYQLERGGLRTAVLDAVQAAYQRADELGRTKA